MRRRQIETIMRQRQITAREAARELASMRQRDVERRQCEGTPEGKAVVQAVESVRREWDSYK